MANIAPLASLGTDVVPFPEASLSIGSSSTLYGLSVYTVCLLKKTDDDVLLFRLNDHLKRLKESASMIGFTEVDKHIKQSEIENTLTKLVNKNEVSTDQFARITLHAVELVPGVRTSDLQLQLSIFLYEAEPILPASGARIKTSLWQRTADTAIPARAKVNGAYVNSALAKQDAIDAGCDDCLFLNQNGYVSELSAANIFLVKNDKLITPDTASDILEGITRRTIIEIAQFENIPVIERKVALTEIYTADEVFACGTSAFVSSIIEIDKRVIADGKPGKVTQDLQSTLSKLQSGDKPDLITKLVQ